MALPAAVSTALLNLSPVSVELNEAQRDVLRSIGDALFAPMTEAEAVEAERSLGPDSATWQREEVPRFLRASFDTYGDRLPAIEGALGLCSSKTAIEGVALLLWLLSTSAGSLLLTGSFKPFPAQDRATREAVIRGWSTSRVATLRTAFSALSSLGLLGIYNGVPEVCKAMGYPDTLPDRANQKIITPSFPFKFEQVSGNDQILKTAFLVVGSGAGGGVVAAELAQAGHKVMIVEKGTYVPHEKLSGSLAETPSMYEAGGILKSEDGSISVLAGATWGGGTTINWSACLKPQFWLRECWANEHGLPYFLSEKFNRSIETVWGRIGATQVTKHSKANQLLLDACDKLGYDAKVISTNTAGHQHDCGHCFVGCTAGVKQSGQLTFLKDAAEAGATLLEGAHVERILFTDPAEPVPPTFSNIQETWPTSQRTRACGVLAILADGRRLIIQASSAVISSGGALNSPALLLRSKIPNPIIGRNLYLHPCAFVKGTYQERINQHEGGILTVVSGQVDNLDGTHHGAKIESTAINSLTQALVYTKWTSSKQHKLEMIRFPRECSWFPLVNDRDPGHVTIDEYGKPRFEYQLSPYDQRSMMAGLIATAKLHLVSGALEINTAQAGVKPFIVMADEAPLNVTDERFVAWLDKVQEAGCAAGTVPHGSAHQMRTCRMGNDPTNSVVDPQGKVWGHRGLYIADTSVFPTCSAVNPMVTVLSVSHSIAQFIKEDYSGVQQ